ncbi:ArsR family transcriptional regulator [Tropicimonas sp. S265A]|uniref:arsenate reductase/protein-tyrosine-phosphatase family protein n=1 Tax=Tropicimonas sp. S265A TaxID=3415134 RepID=UPI003C7E99B9
MEIESASDSFLALSHPGRLSALRLLIRHLPDSLRPSYMAATLGLKPNTLSVYLSALQGAGLVSVTRQGRALHYRAEVGALDALVQYLVADCCRGRSAYRPMCGASAPFSTETVMTKPFNVLFICVGNSARSIMAEALLRDLGGDRFNAHSAGVRPFSELNPFAVEVLARQGHDVSRLSAKTLSTFPTEDAPEMDFVFTVCDLAANEECPPWPGQPLTAHWGQPDPVKVTGTDGEKALAFAETYRQLRSRIQAFVALPLDTLDRQTTQRRLDDLARETANAED